MSAIGATEERFVPAPGKPGMVMTVFTLPSYEFVFKVIRDRFAPPKNTTAAEVRARYRQVLRHDRVGRLVDFQEFERLDFPRQRFAEATLEALLAEAGETVRLVGDRVIVDHLYIGRRVTPLDIHLAEGPAEAAAPAVIDWGLTLRELAAADIFAGDIQLKNFGITRHGRVVFYDYDELCPLSDCRFRRIPPPWLRRCASRQKATSNRSEWWRWKVSKSSPSSPRKEGNSSGKTSSSLTENQGSADISSSGLRGGGILRKRQSLSGQSSS